MVGKKYRIFLSFITVLCLTVTPAESQIVQDDSLALVAIYNNTGGDDWTDNNNWLSDSSVATWKGITVVGDRVTQIDLWNNNLSGSLPVEIGNLSAMIILKMGNNPLSGALPAEIGNCAKLYAIQIFNTNLNGSLPTEMGQLSNLNTIQLYNNELEGSIPVELCDLTNLQTIRLYSNNLTGSIPTEIGNLTGLANLDLERNELSGSIPSEIGNLVNLQSLSLSGNSLNGSIPDEIGNLTNMTSMNMADNQLTGLIPEQVGNLTNLTSINLADNQLNEHIPASLGDLTNLTAIYLQNNQLSGPIPESLKNLTSLMFLNLSENQLEYEVPDIFENLSLLSRLQLHKNALSGAVPLSITNLTSLMYLTLNDNDLTDLPDLSALENMQWLQVEQNALTFEDIEPNIGVASDGFSYAPQDSVGIPVDTSIETGSGLVLVTEVGGRFNVYQWYKDYLPVDGANDSTLIINPVDFGDSGTYTCHISNTVATELTLFHHPFYVYVYQPPREADSLALVDLYNSTNGEGWTNKTNWVTTESLESWYGVTIENDRVVSLDLQQNNLNGTVPSSIGNLTAVTFLSLRNNNLSGSLPVEIGNMAEMRDLDFAFNNLSGEIPESIGNLTELYALFLDFNAFEGNIPLSIGNLKDLMVIYLGGNQLAGSLPDTLCTLLKLTIFHFPDNNLTGAVPAALVSLKQLESIELEHNHLVSFPDISENIPPLQNLRIAHNNFDFGDIEPYIDTGLTTFTYADQDSVHTGMDTTITEGDDLHVTAIVGGSANHYQWKKDGVDIAGAESSTFSVISAQLSDAGSYHCEITSSLVPDLTLYRRPVIVTVEEAVNIADKESGIPKEFILYQNYPNPFNPHTRIRYALPEACHVEITVHNILGQKLATLVSENQRAGYHKTEFNGSQLSSGVYFYKISTEHFSQVEKMIFMQ